MTRQHWSLQPLTPSARLASAHPALVLAQTHSDISTQTQLFPGLTHTRDLCKHTSAASRPNLTSTPLFRLATAHRRPAQPTGLCRRSGPGPGLPMARGPPLMILESRTLFPATQARRGQGGAEVPTAARRPEPPFCLARLARWCSACHSPPQHKSGPAGSRPPPTHPLQLGLAARSRVRGAGATGHSEGEAERGHAPGGGPRFLPPPELLML